MVEQSICYGDAAFLSNYFEHLLDVLLSACRHDNHIVHDATVGTVWHGSRSWQTDRPTDHATRSVTTGCIYVVLRFGVVKYSISLNEYGVCRVFASGMYGDGNSEHQHEPVRLRLLHEAARRWPDVIRHLHRRPAQQESRGVDPAARQCRVPPTHIRVTMVYPQNSTESGVNRHFWDGWPSLGGYTITDFHGV